MAVKRMRGVWCWARPVDSASDVASLWAAHAAVLELLLRSASIVASSSFSNRVKDHCSVKNESLESPKVSFRRGMDDCIQYGPANERRTLVAWVAEETGHHLTRLNSTNGSGVF